jgi:hypothetical protein
MKPTRTWITDGACANILLNEEADKGLNDRLTPENATFYSRPLVRRSLASENTYREYTGVNKIRCSIW